MLPFVFFGQENGEGFVRQSVYGFTAAGLNTGATTYGSTYFGYSAGNNSTGTRNTFVGILSGYKNTTGINNVMIGDRAGLTNTTGRYNTFLGTLSGYKNTTGNHNTFSGMYSGFSNTTGYRNTILGYQSGFLNTTGRQNVMIGDLAGYSNINGTYNTFLGSASGNKNTSGTYNVFNGYQAGYLNTSGHRNTFLGFQSGYKNNSSQGSVFIGHQAGFNETTGNKLYIDNSSTTAPLIYGDFSKNELTVNGKLGIGVTNPTHKLDINTGGGNLKTYNYGLEHTVNASGGWARGFRLRNEMDNKTTVFGSLSGAAYISTGFDINSDPTGYQNQKFTVLTNGNVGIGTTDTKGFRLGVKGKIAAEEVKVAIYNNWSDFVFENEYNLPSLKEVEKHINEKGHLKDIPSASEVAKNGIFLGDMNAKLLQKIEELTLYTIQQQKELEAQHQKNKTLEARLEALEVHLKN